MCVCMVCMGPKIANVLCAAHDYGVCVVCNLYYKKFSKFEFSSGKVVVNESKQIKFLFLRLPASLAALQKGIAITWIRVACSLREKCIL